MPGRGRQTRLRGPAHGAARHACGGAGQAFLADPLGVGALLATADGRLVLLRRSHHVAEAPGKLDVPGGHPEPQAVAGGVPTASLRCEDLPPDLVVEEIFASVIKEIRDEVNLPPETLSPPRLLGLVRNETTAGRATAAFFVRCSLTAEETRERYEAGGAEAHESTAVVFVQAEELLGPGGPWAELCPSAKGAVTLYHEVGALL
ncbi:nucleoside diphosphate-linked moiety X motif 22 [Alligator mississippiensis]|uniref:Nucleoside diphosphate-linked moiety X motif 22 n=1 Tax=Alligator mississippiensis TaxID=8496 RepID=A0A151P557_ALLMI|nr:nucleoside diphosphate-linked moiety X motif 22 [Alligator mississippiensis]